MNYVTQCRKLFMLHVRMQLGLSAFIYSFKHDRKKFRQSVLILICVAYGFGSLVVMYSMLFGGILRGVTDPGMARLALMLALIFAMSATLVFGIFQIAATVFGAKDVERYIVLPVKPGAIFFAKFGMSYLVELAAALLILLPTYIIYSSSGMSGGLGFWAAAILSLPFVPLLPMTLAALIALPLARLSAKLPWRGALTVIMTIVLTVFGMVIGMAVPNALERVYSDDPEMLARMLSDSSHILNAVTAVFPPAGWLTEALTAPWPWAPLWLLLFVAVSAVVLFFTVRLAGRLYYASVLPLLEEPGGRKSSKKRAAPLSYKRGNVLAALTLAELKQLFRSPLYLMNSLAGVFMGLTILIMPLMMGENWDELRQVLSNHLNSDGHNSGLTALIVMLILSSVGIFNAAACTALSREGKSLWIWLTVPVRPSVQIMGKLYGALCVSLISLFATSACIAVSMPAIIPWLLPALPAAVFMAAAMTALSMLPDIMRPKLKWDSEAEAMKQNFNSFLGMLVSMPALIPPALMLLWAALAQPPMPLLISAVTLLCAGMAAGAFALARYTADSAYPRLGERL